MSRDLATMKWDEFRALLVGIGPDTALGRIVSVRMEDDKNVLKKFTKEQHRIRNEWKARRAEGKTKEQTGDFIEQMKNMFIQMSGGR